MGNSTPGRKLWTFTQLKTLFHHRFHGCIQQVNLPLLRKCSHKENQHFWRRSTRVELRLLCSMPRCAYRHLSAFTSIRGELAQDKTTGGFQLAIGGNNLQHISGLWAARRLTSMSPNMSPSALSACGGITKRILAFCFSCRCALSKLLSKKAITCDSKQGDRRILTEFSSTAACFLEAHFRLNCALTLNIR